MMDVVNIVQQAGQKILPYWRKHIDIQCKEDNSPVTQADLAAHHYILSELTQLTPDIPVLSEEACHIPMEQRQLWQYWWLVDPLDGTKEFIDGKDDFTVNIALIKQGKVIFGAVGVPVTQTCFFGGKQLGAWKCQEYQDAQKIHVQKATPSKLHVVASQRHNSPQQHLLLEQLQALTHVTLKSIGSSLKFCLLANGDADCYPRLAPTCQWDTAAAQAVLEGAGGAVYTLQGEYFDYTMRSDYLNPYFIAIADTQYWKTPILSITQRLKTPT